MEEYYLYIMSVHIIFVVSWMAGLFYSVRLFIYHTEAKDRPEPERSILQKEYEKIEAKLWNIITTPAMVLTVLAGIGMVCIRPWYLDMPWFQVKLGFVALLLVYHFICQKIMKQLKRGESKISSFKLRLWNEVATVLLVAIVFTVVLKSAVNWVYGLVGLIVFSVVIMMGVKWYKYYRKKNNC
ncbi:protoporphyrinogen oxidase HemJ [Pedobacter sp. MC2016-24]|uniref:protoporphyrinogen oxidase HemJ n=1 Tax=Pedobacter sp. MC2016-24 TaxID=2780090 RepID=UPI00187E16E9|nr:protoporphyrinogen oxidase HemJ [Pedobacter sp. MC2016-24]MBE9602449.1 protoporphyrinogen oxidase HemJ [Pedobacter sp. MC2016-24]